MLKKGVRKAPRGILVDGIQRFGSLLRQRVIINSARDPVIQTKGHHLPPQHIRSLQKDAGRRHLSGQHLPDLCEEVQVMRAAAVGERGCQRIAIASPCTTNPLQKTCLIRRHRAQHHSREITDIHAHLQRWRGGQKVLVPAMWCF